jgi:hypothetical protein
MYFFKRGGWQVQFLEADLKTSLPRKLTFRDPEKIRELVRRGEAWGTSEAKQMREHAIETGKSAGLFEADSRSVREAEAGPSYSLCSMLTTRRIVAAIIKRFMGLGPGQRLRPLFVHSGLPRVAACSLWG